MKKIGIIANPMSGRDIRRIVSYATVIDNNEKNNIIQRAMIGAQSMGAASIVFMPEAFTMAQRNINLLKKRGQLNSAIEILNMETLGNVKDTVRAAELMENDKDVGCIISLGGDGTNRAIAKSIDKTPLIAISTGTNNVYPDWIEGTVAGIAAGLVAGYGKQLENSIQRQKKIKVKINEVFRDIALIDAVLSNDPIIGSKAIWKPDRILGVAVSRCHPATIGFSAIAGVREVVTDTDNYGGFVNVGEEYDKVKTSLAPGVVTVLGVSQMTKIPLDDSFVWKATTDGTIALDGEREIQYDKGDRIEFIISKEGPKKVVVRELIEQAQQLGFFAQ